MSKVIDNILRVLSRQIRGETKYSANTATRVGTLFENITDSKVNWDDVSTDETFANASDEKVASQKAVKLFFKNNNEQPNLLISGGVITIAVDDGTHLSIHLIETVYKLSGVQYIQGAGNFNLNLRPSAGLFRIDVGYLDITGFHVITGATAATPIKPTVPIGAFELSSILVGFDNDLGPSPVPGVPTLSAVVAAGNIAYKSIIVRQPDVLHPVGIGAESADGETGTCQLIVNEAGEPELWFGKSAMEIVGKVKVANVTDNRNWEMPDKDGTVALLDDFEGVYPTQYTATGGETEVTLSELIGGRIIQIIREIQPLKFADYTFTTIDGKIVINGNPLESGETLYITYSK